MLKLTNSFSRYLSLSIQNVNKIRVSCTTGSCAESCDITKLSFVRQQLWQQRRTLTQLKSASKKQSSNTNALKKSSQMSESLQPTITNVSYGGNFEINPAGEADSVEQWCKQGEPSGHVTQGPCQVPPDFRVWENLGTTDKYNEGNSLQFTVVSYNVLAQYLLECHPYLYTDCSPHDLKWKVRAARIYDEILNLQPDIICLQEVQASHLNSFYKKLERVGYEGVFKQKTGHCQDGCAIYYKKSMFNLISHVSVEFYQPSLPVLNRDNIGVVVKLSPAVRAGGAGEVSPAVRAGGAGEVSPVVVATTHLLYNPVRADVRLAQMQLFLAEIDRFAYCGNGSGHLPIILTGDFNSAPDSAVVKLLDRGYVSSMAYRDTSDWQDIGVTDNCQHLSVVVNRESGIETDMSMLKVQHQEYGIPPPSPLEPGSGHHGYHQDMFNTGTVCQALQLGSVYSQVKADGNHEATTYQDRWLTVDYIYFSCFSSLQLERRLRLPTANECEALGKLPNDVFGSDHLALAATFRLGPPRVASAL